ncbi:protein disulfide-isomerase tmx3a-like isoform X2 [Nelusetta ayraudi]|uniref:protein disulfide-isomerase tmx3a-like isoform X2 n=1 Tax=Nelusetta ayraudi TaxID=303726 RepID=UPI003F72DBA9
MAVRRNIALLSALLLVSVSAYVEELDDSFLETRGVDDIWLIKFYTPWCHLCRQLDPLWHQVGSELRSLGSPVNVGKSDGSANTGMAKEFHVRGYPTILMWKKDIKYSYPGPRTRDGILDFANRVGGPLVRSLSSLQLFQHAMSRHDVMFMYVGATSPLKAVSLPILPAVLVFKDGTYYTYNEERDGELKSWIDRERFPNYSKIDSFTLYAMGDSGKLVVLALVEELGSCDEGLRLKGLVEKVAADYRETYSRSFIFGFMEGSDYIQGLVMGEVTLPSLIVVDLSIDAYFLPPSTTKKEKDLLDFLDGVLDGSIQYQGGNSIHQRILRIIYEVKSTVLLVYDQSPAAACLLVSFPFLMISVFFYTCWRVRSAMKNVDGDEATHPSAPLPQRRKILADKKSD